MSSASGRPPIEQLVSGRPKSWQGMPLEWSSADDPTPVFVSRFVAPIDDARTPVWLFGAGYELSEVLVGGDSLGDGYFVEYLVVEPAGQDCWRLHRLLQQESVTYSSGGDIDDYVPALDVDASRHSLDVPPRWKATEAVWPTHDGMPMTFLGQTELRGWACNVYLFWAGADGSSNFKVVEQESEVQTADEHYRLESD